MIAIVVLTPGGLSIAERLKRALPESRIHALASRVQSHTADEVFAQTADHFLFRLCAALPFP